jgi:hypothetical protein
MMKTKTETKPNFIVKAVFLNRNDKPEKPIGVYRWNRNSASAVLESRFEETAGTEEDIARFRGKSSLSPLELACVILQKQSEFNRQ